MREERESVNSRTKRLSLAMPSHVGYRYAVWCWKHIFAVPRSRLQAILSLTCSFDGCWEFCNAFQNYIVTILLSLVLEITTFSFALKLQYDSFFVPRFRESVGTLNLIRPSFCPSVRPSVRPSVCHKNFNLSHNFWSINDRALIFGMHDHCDIPFLLVQCDDLDLDLWPVSRSNLLPSGGPQFFEFAC